MPEPVLDIVIEPDDQLQAFFKSMDKFEDNPKINQAMVDASQVTLATAQQNLTSMVYQKAEGWYRRKAGAGLRGKTVASGQPGSSLKKVRKEGETLISGVSSELEYAKYVHFGTGVKAGKGSSKTRWIFKDEDGIFRVGVSQEPKPYLTNALQTTKKVFMSILKRAMGF